MKIIVDINHPAHVHFFKNFILEAEKMGHEIMITASDKDIAMQLLDYYKFEYKNLGSYGHSLFEKVSNLFAIDYKMYKVVKDFCPDIITGIASARAAHVSFVTKNIKSYIFDDTEHAIGQRALYKCFASKIFVPDCFIGKLSDKYTTYKGYHELAYLHPNRFTADYNVVKETGIKENEKFFIVRFIAWDATHDIGKKGYTTDEKFYLVEELSKYGRVIITSEKNVPDKLKPYCINIHPAKIHHLLAFSSLYIGEGATMASEAVILGTPSIYVNPLVMGYINDEVKYGLFHIPNPDKAIDKAIEIARNAEKYKLENEKKRKELFSTKEDVTAFMLKTILNVTVN